MPKVEKRKFLHDQVTVKNQGPSQTSFLSLILIFLSFLSWAPGLAFSASPSFEEQFEQALSSFKKGDISQSLKVFLKLEEEAGEHRLRPDILFMQGQAWRALGNWPEAAQAFSRAAENHPLLSDYALFSQGEAQQKTGEGGKSIEVYQRLIALYPQSLLVPQARLRVAELYFQSGDYLKTVGACEQLLKGDSGKELPAQARLLVGQAREGLEQWAEAIKAYQEIWLKYPLHGAAGKAKIRWDTLVREKRIPVEKIPPEALFNRSLEFYQANSFESALGEMNQIEGYPIQSYPPHYNGELWVDDLYFHRGMGHFRLKQYSRAVETFEFVVRHSRNEVMAEKSLFWMFQALARKGRKEEALGIYSLFQASYPRSSFMAQAQYIQAAIYEDTGETGKAVSLYRKIAEKFPQSSLRFAALWNGGWLLYQTKDYAAAVQTWDQLKRMEPNSRWMEKVLYWQGRTLGKMGRAREAEENYGQLLKNYPTSYYSQLASARGVLPLSRKGVFPALQDRPLLPFLEMKANSPGPKGSPLEKSRLLVRLTLVSLAVRELEAAQGEGANGEDLWLEISRLYREAEDYYRSNLLVRKKFSLRPLSTRPAEREKALYRLAYPMGNPALIHRYSQAGNLDPALLCAVILEESRFHSQAVSAAGARGLMQVLPRTGKQMAKELKVQGYSAEQLFEPRMNVRLGSWYLSRLLGEFGGKVHLALAAYNAGPHLVRKWLAKAPSAAEDEFVEAIPYAETRYYVIRVISSAQVYRTLY